MTSPSESDTREKAPSASVQVHRHPERARYDVDSVRDVLDAAMLCHVASIDDDGRAIVLPTLHARVGDVVYVHGSAASHNLRRSGTGADVSLCVSVVDGLVLAARVFNHSVNYRSVVVRGTIREVSDDDEKLRALEAFTERLLPGRWAEVEPPDGRELAATTVLALPIREASVKVRTGWPSRDAGEDPEVWVGVVPVHLAASAPVPHPDAAICAKSPAAERFVRVLTRGSSGPR